MTKFYYMSSDVIFLKIFCLIFLLGIIFFIVWAIRALDKKQLKKWFIGLLVVGLLGMIASSSYLMEKKDDEGWKAGKCEYCEELCGTPES